jgi:hypothetical protein
VTLASHPPGESPKSANARDLLQNMSLNRVEDFFIADVGLDSRRKRIWMTASGLESDMDAEVAKNCVRHVAVKIARYCPTVRATSVQQHCAPAQRIWHNVLIVQA